MSRIENSSNMDFYDLKFLLSKENFSVCDTDDTVYQKFKEIAEILLNRTAIRKGHKTYHMKDIEFYLYKNDHRDIITYPRTCEAGQWFFHSSGIDLSFESNVTMQPNEYDLFQPILDSSSFFGGILIRQIYPEGTSSECAKKYKLDGPHKVEWELFDKFDAFNEIKDFPHLVPCENQKKEMQSSVRQKLLTSSKTPTQKIKELLDYNYYACEIQESELVASFNLYKDAKYRFIV